MLCKSCLYHLTENATLRLFIAAGKLSRFVVVVNLLIVYLYFLEHFAATTRVTVGRFNRSKHAPSG